MAFRVPTLNVSVVDLTAKISKPASQAEIEKVLREASKDPRWKGIFHFTEEDVVSSDFMSDTHSCVVDSKASIYLNDTFIKLVAWVCWIDFSLHFACVLAR